MDRTEFVLEELRKWQTEAYEEVDTASDIRVFNAIGTLIGLVTGNLMNMTKAHVFLTELLSLDKEEKERAYNVFTECYEKGMKERYKDGESV